MKTLLDHQSMVADVAMVAKIQMTHGPKIPMTHSRDILLIRRCLLIGRIFSPVCVIGLQGMYLVDQQECNLIM